MELQDGGSLRVSLERVSHEALVALNVRSGNAVKALRGMRVVPSKWTTAKRA
jgi:hypothetical protein